MDRLYAGRFESALQLAPSVLSVKPGDGFANLVVTVQLIKRGDYRGAEQQLAKIGAENQLGPLRDYVTAWLRAGDKDFAAARTMLGKMRTPSGERCEAPSLVIQAQFDEMAGDKAAAEAKYRRAAQLDPSGLRVALAVADGLRRLGKTDDARALLKSFGDKFSDSVVMDGLLAANAPAPKPPMTFAPVYFAFDKSALSKASKDTLDGVVKFLNANSAANVLVTGYTDDRGSDDYNAKLGARRATVVKDYLVSKGITASRIQTATKGEADQLADALLDARLGDDVITLTSERWQQLRNGNDPYWRAIGRDALRLDRS